MNGLVFGAGNIGRGFLGLLLSKTGYKVTFVDLDESKISSINNHKEYPVYVVSENGIQTDQVHNVSAIHAQNYDSVIDAIVNSEVILTAVGKNALAHLAPALAEGLMKRVSRRPKSEVHVVVIACENVQDNTSYLSNLLQKYVPKERWSKIREKISFPNCVVDRIVPNTLPVNDTNPIAVAVEEYYQLEVDTTALVAEFPKIHGIGLSTNLGSALEQKLCTLNMAHAILGYFGYFKKYKYVHEAIQDKTIYQLLEGALTEVSFTISRRHNNITPEMQKAYSEKVIKRFRNSYLRDEIVRVARDPQRKLGPADRLIQPMTLSWELGVIPSYLVSGVTAALHYNYSSDKEAQLLYQLIQNLGIEKVLSDVSGIRPKTELSRLIKSNFLFRDL